MHFEENDALMNLESIIRLESFKDEPRGIEEIRQTDYVNSKKIFFKY